MMLMVGAGVALWVAQLAAGWGLRKLRPWSKFVAGILVGIGLIRSFPVLTLAGGIGVSISVLILYLLFSAKGRKVLSPAYAEIVAQTPHLHSRTPPWVWISIVLIVILILAFAIFSPAVG
jgi:hypothetical protein